MDFDSSKNNEHILQNRWSLWYFKPKGEEADWTECQNFVTSVDTVEEFWNLIAFVDSPSKLNKGCDYSFFKHGVKPTWEDKQNLDGGRWVVNLDRRMPPKDFDGRWTQLLMAIAGDEFGEYTDELCGVVLNIRERGNKLAIWTKSKDTENNDSIGKIFRKLINLPNAQMTYLTHKTSSKVN